MHTPPNAARRRPTRSGGTHLTLVTAQDAAADENGEQQTGRHAAPKLPIAGSATVRALLALGALLSAIGMSIGRADAVRSHQSSGEQADNPEAPMPVDDGTDVPVEAPRTAAVAQQVSAAHWAPTVRPAQSYTYTSTPAPGPGKHRRPTTGRPDSTGPVTPTGRHRRADAPTRPNGHAGGHAQQRRAAGVRAA